MLEGIRIESLNKLVDRAIFSDYHNIFILWGELGKGKTSLMMWMLYRIVKDWSKVLSFELEPHVCMECGHSWDAKQPYVYELPCPKCSKETVTTSLGEAVAAVRGKMNVENGQRVWVEKPKLVIPFPYDYTTGFVRKFQEGTSFSINTSRARGKITQTYPYMNFSFHEIRNTIETAVELRAKLPAAGWDDIAVYFHRSNIQYMHPDVKNFFSRYNFVRKYLGNLIITVPTPSFVPEQLMVFCTADVLLNNRGSGDFDVVKEVRNFFGKNKTWAKHYDGRDVTWDKVPIEWFNAYEEIRHAHAVEAFEKPEEIFVTTMPKKQEFTEQDSLFS